MTERPRVYNTVDLFRGACLSELACCLKYLIGFYDTINTTAIHTTTHTTTSTSSTTTTTNITDTCLLLLLPSPPLMLLLLL